MFEVLCAVIAITIVGLAWSIWRPILKWSAVAIGVLCVFVAIVTGAQGIYEVAKEKWSDKKSSDKDEQSSIKNIESSRWALIFEAERRGLLSIERVGAIQGLRRRGEIGPFTQIGLPYHRYLSDADLLSSLKKPDVGMSRSSEIGENTQNPNH